MNTQIASPVAIDAGRSRTAALTISAAFFLIGLSLVYVSGFANADVLHNGAHDSRHSLVFPCH